ncbi:c-type heme family protein, partial [Christiangramia aquimixticola]
AENGIKSDPNIQKFENGEVLLYTKPITIPSGMCLNCHGEPEKEISKETLVKLDQLYPSDRARGHKVGDLRGMWSVRIPKKEVVKRL